MVTLPPGLPAWVVVLPLVIMSLASLLIAVSKMLPQNSSHRLSAWEKWLEHRRLKWWRDLNLKERSDTNDADRDSAE